MPGFKLCVESTEREEGWQRGREEEGREMTDRLIGYRLMLACQSFWTAWSLLLCFVCPGQEGCYLRPSPKSQFDLTVLVEESLGYPKR